MTILFIRVNGETLYLGPDPRTGLLRLDDTREPCEACGEYLIETGTGDGLDTMVCECGARYPVQSLTRQ